jgi:hypothetical protein
MHRLRCAPHNPLVVGGGPHRASLGIVMLLWNFGVSCRCIREPSLFHGVEKGCNEPRDADTDLTFIQM